MHMQTITIDAADQAAVRRGLVRRSRFALGMIGAFAILGAITLVCVLAGWIPAMDLWSPLMLFAAALLLLVVLLASAARQTSTALPLGSEHSLAVSDETLDLAGPAGSSHHRWAHFSRAKRGRGVVILVVRPTRKAFVLVGRLVSDEALAPIIDRIERAHSGAGAATAKH